ncbi:hypothetical protein LG202_13640 [Methylobacillus methanolivorans]
MKLFAIAFSACLLVFLNPVHASPYTDKKTFEDAAKQDMLKGQSNRDSVQFQGLLVTEFEDSQNLCGEVKQPDEPEWKRFIKIFDKDTERFESVWIEPSDTSYEVEEFKRNQFDYYWDRRCSSIR